jgi:4-hydroxybenzoate polyprenyltransferase
MLFFPGWNTLLAGYLVAKGEASLFIHLKKGIYSTYFWESELVFSMLAFMFAMGGSFILNQLQDTDSDHKNQKLFLIDEKLVPRNGAILESILLIVAAVLTGLFLNKTILLLLILFIVITAYLYNYRPFQFKNRPIGGLILNAFMGWIAFGLGWALLLPISKAFWINSLPYLLLNTSLYLLTILPDEVGDRLSGKITICVKFGKKPTIYLAGLLYTLSFSLAWILNDHIILFITILLLYFMLKLVISTKLFDGIRTIKIAVFFFSLVICIKFPLYIILMVSVFFLTRYYYQRRFQFDYPNFRGE